MPRGELKVFACRSGKRFGERVARSLVSMDCLEEGLSPYKFREFECGENKQYGLEESVREADVYVIQSCARDHELGYSADDNAMQLFRFIDGMRHASAGRITAVVPMLPYSRQDKIWERGEPFSAKLIAKFLEASGADRVVTMDLHSDQIIGFYDINVEPLHASQLFLKRLREVFGPERLRDSAYSSTDVGGASIVRHYSKKTGGSVAIGDKVKHYDSDSGKEVEKVNIVGDVKGKRVFIVDDMNDTAGSFVRAAEGVVEGGAIEVYGLFAHGIFSGPAEERMRKAYEDGILKKAYCADTVAHPDEFYERNPFIEEISVAPLFARVIQKLHDGEGVSEIYLE